MEKRRMQKCVKWLYYSEKAQHQIELFQKPKYHIIIELSSPTIIIWVLI